jgi:hypothetical protein
VASPWTVPKFNQPPDDEQHESRIVDDKLPREEVKVQQQGSDEQGPTEVKPQTNRTNHEQQGANVDGSESLGSGASTATHRNRFRSVRDTIALFEKPNKPKNDVQKDVADHPAMGNASSEEEDEDDARKMKDMSDYLDDTAGRAVNFKLPEKQPKLSDAGRQGLPKPKTSSKLTVLLFLFYLIFSIVHSPYVLQSKGTHRL